LIPDRRERSRLASLGLLLASALASFAAFEIVGGALLRRTLGEDNVADVDHRLKPNARRGINADGIRNPHGPEHYGEDSWNVVFLGDSYTYGVYVKAEHAFPAVVGSLLNEASLPRPVKVANFGWASSSPVLSLRLLRDIGARYRPDLVVLCLDMTDFHDDLRYSRLLAEQGTRLSPSRFLLRRSGLDRPLARARERLGLRGPDEPPAERFFAARQPLHQSRPFLRETEQNIRAISEQAAELGAQFLLVMLPRPFQYNPAESPDNWERDHYDPASPHAHAPFEWLADFDSRTPFPSVSLLADFRESGVFPTAFRHDPHWNEAGHQIAARGVARQILGLLETKRLRVS
jgi:hypothetical protein